MAHVSAAQFAQAQLETRAAGPPARGRRHRGGRSDRIPRNRGRQRGMTPGAATKFAAFSMPKRGYPEKAANGLAIRCHFGYTYGATSFSDPVPFGSAFDLQLCRAAAQCGR